MRIRRRIAVVLAAVGVAAGLGFSMGGDAHAISGACFYYPDSGNHAALNAWNGGPDINVYHSCADPNDRFTILFPGGNNIQLEFTGGGANNGKCIGDFNNNQGTASTGLTGCNPAGWGTLFQENLNANCGSGQIAFWNNHWQGFLGPAQNYTDGSNFYLNNFGYYCFNIG